MLQRLMAARTSENMSQGNSSGSRSPALQIQMPTSLLDAVVCPGTKFNSSSREIGALFVRSDGYSQFVEQQSPKELIHSLFKGGQSESELWREIRPLLDNFERDFHLNIKYDMGGYGGKDTPGKRESTVSGVNVTTGRPQWISVRTEFVSAIIEADQVLFFLNGDSATFRLFLEELTGLLQDNPPDDFDFFVLESILAASIKIQRTRLQSLCPAVNASLQDARGQSSDGDVASRLFPITCCLSKFKDNLRPMNEVLHNIIWSERLQNGSQTSEDLMDILHPWYKSGKEIIADVSVLLEEVEQTTKFINASMDSARNRYLIFELGITIVALAFSFGSLVSGIFGMNLKSGIEDWPRAFYFVLALTTIVSIIFVAASFWFFFKNRPREHLKKLYYTEEREFFQSFNNRNGFDDATSHITMRGYNSTGILSQQTSPIQSLPEGLKKLTSVQPSASRENSSSSNLFLKTEELKTPFLNSSITSIPERKDLIITIPLPPHTPATRGRAPTDPTPQKVTAPKQTTPAPEKALENVEENGTPEPAPPSPTSRGSLLIKPKQNKWKQQKFKRPRHESDPVEVPSSSTDTGETRGIGTASKGYNALQRIIHLATPRTEDWRRFEDLGDEWTRGSELDPSDSSNRRNRSGSRSARGNRDARRIPQYHSSPNFSDRSDKV